MGTGVIWRYVGDLGVRCHVSCSREGAAGMFLSTYVSGFVRWCVSGFTTCVFVRACLTVCRRACRVVARVNCRDIDEQIFLQCTSVGSER